MLIIFLIINHNKNLPRGAPKVCPLLDSMRHLPWGHVSVTTRTNRAAVGSSCTRRTRGRACDDRARLGTGLVAGKRLSSRIPGPIRSVHFASRARHVFGRVSPSFQPARTVRALTCRAGVGPCGTRGAGEGACGKPNRQAAVYLSNSFSTLFLI